MPLPKSVKIGAFDYTINDNVILDVDGNLGRCRHANQIIDIYSGQAAGSKRDTLLHELLHAVSVVGGLSHLVGIDDEGEERLIRFFTPWLLGILRDNPKLLTFLLEK